MDLPLRVLPSSKVAHDMHFIEWNDCTKCVIGRYAQHHVFARGTVPSDILFIGEAPGNKENEAGYPFVGPSGRVLDKWIMAAQNYREFTCGDGIFSYAITNMVCCRPCNNEEGPIRAPGIQELENCRPRLTHFIDAIAKPKLIVLIGKPASRHIPRKYGTIPSVHIKHPSWFLRLHLEGSETERVQIDLLSKFITKELANGTHASPAADH